MGPFVPGDVLCPPQLGKLKDPLWVPRVTTTRIHELDICLILRVSQVFWRLKINLCAIREGSVLSLLSPKFKVYLSKSVVFHRESEQGHSSVFQ